MKYYLGLMSGTSMDGIDAALVDVETHQLIKGITLPYTAQIKIRLVELVKPVKHDLSALYELNTLIGREFGGAALKLLDNAGIPAEKISAIGSHGQTILHDSQAEIPYTIQIGCAHTIAEMTQIPVVADFRTRDLVLGGQGAPLAPLYHQALFAHLGYPVAVVNIGGIANVSILFNDNEVVGYDVGPGNCLMDAWVATHQGQAYDAKGAWAAQGVVIEPLLQELLSDPFFNKHFPKSIGKEYFSQNSLKRFLKPSYQPVDVQATLLRLTAQVIANALHAHQIAFKQVLICGGGAHNTRLLTELSQLLSPVEVGSTEAIGIDPNFIEAQMMAWLAQQMLEKKALNLKPVTGAAKKAVLGVFYPAGIDK